MFKTIEQVWQAVNSGKTVYWGNTSYKVYIEEEQKGNGYQRNHFSNKSGKLLSVRCISNYFGSLIHEDDLGSLFIEGNK